MAPINPRFNTIESEEVMECPKCGGEVYDNRAKNVERVAEGKRPMPELKCKDESCGWKKWPPKGNGANSKPVASRGPKWTWRSLQDTYMNCVKIVRPVLINEVHKSKGSNHTLEVTAADVCAAAATLFIAASRDGVQPKAQAEQESYENIPAALVKEEGDDDDLPW